MITWRPIAELPDELKDGREVLLWMPYGAVIATIHFDGSRYDANGLIPTNEQPTDFAEINAPEGQG